MALVSPGVEVTIIDQSQYLPAPTNSIPLIVLATAQNKADPTSTAVAAGTTAANAGKLYQVTSQRDLVTLYGNPFFYTTSTGTPIQGYELNEYGLLAAYSALGVTNRVYTLRADIDLASLVGQTGRPTGAPADGTYWLDTTNSTWGIYEFNQTTGQFILQSPIVITDSAFVSAGYPVASVGNIGDYAVIAIPTYDFATAATAGQFFYKNSTNTWTRIGTGAWLKSYPTVQASNSNPSLQPGDYFNISINGNTAYRITVQNSPNNLVSIVAQSINNLGYPYLSAGVVGGKLQIYSSQTGQSNLNSDVPANIVVTAGSGTVLTDLGITAGTYNQPAFYYGTSAQQPLWQSGQTHPAPSGSVWIKVGSAGNGLNTVVSQWNGTTATWINESSLSVNTATYADNVFIHTTSSGNYAVILSTGTNAYEQLTEDLNFLEIPFLINNQTYETMELYGQTIMKGGRQLYYSANNITFLTKAKLKEDGDDMDISSSSGIVVTAKCVKNRQVKPKQVKFEISFEKGMNKFKGLEAFCRPEFFETIGIAKGKMDVNKSTGEMTFVPGGTRWYVRHLSKHVAIKQLFTEDIFTDEVLNSIEPIVNDYFRYKSIEEMEDMNKEFEKIVDETNDDLDENGFLNSDAADLFE